MAVNRNELISDWREELAAAGGSAKQPQRPAWIARMRVRLYRFLLACYGDGGWTADEPQEFVALGDATVSASGAAERPLTGKPAKSLGQIRSVLQAVAGAQGAALAPGPLTQGLPPESWVVVAAASSKLRTGRCYELLRARGLHVRVSDRGDDQMVEVPACERQEAFEIIERNRSRIHAPPKTPRTQPIPLWCRIASMAVLAMWVAGLCAATLLVLIWGMSQPQRNDPPREILRLPEFYRMWGSLYVALLLVFLLGLLRKNQPIATFRPPRKR